MGSKEIGYEDDICYYEIDTTGFEDRFRESFKRNGISEVDVDLIINKYKSDFSNYMNN